MPTTLNAEQQKLAKAVITASCKEYGLAVLARALGVKKSQLWRMQRDGWVASHHVLRLEHVTTGRCSRYLTRPDLYPPQDYPGPKPPASAISAAKAA